MGYCICRGKCVPLQVGNGTRDFVSIENGKKSKNKFAYMDIFSIRGQGDLLKKFILKYFLKSHCFSKKSPYLCGRKPASFQS